MSLLTSLLAAGAALATPPNVVFIAVDDLRPDLACYGESHMITPNMDRLARQGRMFRNHYVAVPTCGASRYALMTGLRPTAASDDNDAFDLAPATPPAEPESWADLLRRNGWHTASLGKITHEPDGYRWNFPVSYDSGRQSASFPDLRFSWNEIVFGHGRWGAQRYPLFAYADGSGRVAGSSPAYEIGVDALGASLPDDAYPDGQIADAAVDKLREYAQENRRFCLAVGFFKPHLPFNAPKAYWDLYNPATLPAPSPEAIPAGAIPATVTNSREINSYTANGDRAVLRHAYFACVSYVDAQVGKVLDALDSLGLADNTLVVLWGDHGWCLDDYGLIGKHKLLERALEAPLIIRPPAALRPEVFAGVAATGVVETVDLYPTIAEICGLAAPASAVGSSLVPLLRNPLAPGKGHAYSRWGTLSSVRTAGWRLISTGSASDLYDLSVQRYERQDVSAAQPAMVAELEGRLAVQAARSGRSYAQWAAGDPLLADPAGDADGDGARNDHEYAAGSDPRLASSRPDHSLAITDLSARGLTSREELFGYRAAVDADDLALLPLTSTDLQAWTFPPLEYFDALPEGPALYRLRFRVAPPGEPTRYFRTEQLGRVPDP